jgi:hypothetical protein
MTDERRQEGRKGAMKVCETGILRVAWGKRWDSTSDEARQWRNHGNMAGIVTCSRCSSG